MKYFMNVLFISVVVLFSKSSFALTTWCVEAAPQSQVDIYVYSSWNTSEETGHLQVEHQFEYETLVGYDPVTGEPVFEIYDDTVWSPELDGTFNDSNWDIYGHTYAFAMDSSAFFVNSNGSLDWSTRADFPYRCYYG